MDPISAAMNPASSEEELKALSDSLRGRKRAADFFSLSTIDPINRMAQNSQSEVMDAAEQQGQLRKALAQREQQAEQQDLNRQNQMDVSAQSQAGQNARLASSQEFSDEAWARSQDSIQPTVFETPDGEKVFGRMQGGMLVDRNGLPIPEGSVPFRQMSGRKPSAGERTGYSSKKGLSDQISALEVMASELPEEAVAQLNNTGGEVALDITKKFIPGTAADLAARNYLYTSPEAQQAMEKFARLESEVLNLISGKQITNLEADKVNKWSPNQPGLTLDQRLRRAKNLQERVQSEMNSFESNYPDWSLRDQEQTQGRQSSGGFEYIGEVQE